ncbi:MAG: hypothetical protein F6J87_04465 [Spirulina sp. SIO3F2]|nr:hypothetical protein [Spirulina sp. SIO3F2]
MNQSSHQFIAQKKAKRQALLLEMYYQSGGSIYKQIPIETLYEDLRKQSTDLQWTKEDVADICSSLKGEKIIQETTDIGVPDFWISHISYVRLESRGIRLIESMTDEQQSPVSLTVDNSISVGGDFQGNLAGKDIDSRNSVQNFGNIHNPDLNEAIAEIQELVQQLIDANPPITTIEEMNLAIQAVEQIEAKPAWKQKAIRAAKSVALEALKSSLIGKCVVAAIESWEQELR